MLIDNPRTNAVVGWWLKTIPVLLILSVFLPGCKSRHGSPINPDSAGTGTAVGNAELTGKAKQTKDGTVSKAIWGVWDVAWDEQNGFQVVPQRGIEYTLNVNTFMQPPMGSVTNLSIDVVNQEKLFITGHVVVDVSLTHPFPALTQFTGFDVLGVVIGKANYIANSNIDIAYAQPKVNTILLNADGYTRWMNPLEFTTPGILGYTEGKLGNKGQFWNSTINPYKYFANGLHSTTSIVNYYKSGSAVAQRGAFLCGTTNTRRYSLHFPMIAKGVPDVRFQYAVIASWCEPFNIPPLSVPGDFPAAANMQEPFHCEISTVGSTLYWNNLYDNGGQLFLTLEVFDWNGGGPSGIVSDIKEIYLDSPDEFINGGSPMVFKPGSWTVAPGSCANSVKIAFNVGKVKPGGPCPYDNDVLITLVTAGEGDYSNGLNGAYPSDGVLSAYARLFYDMGNICNDPPEVWFENCPKYTISVANRTFKWDGRDDVTPNNKLQYRYKLDNAPWSDWQTNLKHAYFENMTEEQHTVYVECRDLDNQVSSASCTFVVDLPPVPMPPKLAFVNCTNYVRTSNYTFFLDISDDFTPVSKMKVRYDYNGGGWVNLPDGSTQITINGLTSGGPYHLLVEIEDLDKMIAQAECNFNVNFAPSVTITNCPSQDLNLDAYQFMWAGTDPEMDALEFSTQLDAQAWSAWGVNTDLNVLGLTSGNHVFRVRVRDALGGTAQTQCNFSVNFAPSITIINEPAQDVNTTSYQFNWVATDDRDSPLTMQYNVEKDGVWQGWQVGISSFNWTPLSSGNHTIRVRVRDTGNPQLWAEDVCNFFVNFKPSVNITNCPSGVWPSSDINFTWIGSDDNSPAGGMSYSYRLNGGAWSAWSLGQLSASITGLTNTDHVFEVRVRDTGNPQLTCETPPNTCAVCYFTVDTNCASPPPNVTNFQATDNDLTLGNRQVRLTWDAIPGCVDFYDIERRNYVSGSGWVWQPLQSVAHPTTTYLDTNARYSGIANPIEYRIRARNISGNSPGWATDTGYPILRSIGILLQCWAEDMLGTNASTTWERGLADYTDCITFWNKYGLHMVLKNSGGFVYFTEPEYRNLTGSEDTMLHNAHRMDDTMNVYYVDSSNGNYSRGYCMVQCPGSMHNLDRSFIVLCKNTRGVPPNENEIVLAHEIGHGFTRLFDIYLLDTNFDIIKDSTCAIQNTWCITPPNTPPLFCEDNAAYPENPGASGKIPKQLMWYSFIAPVSHYDLYHTQWAWFDTWITGYEGNFPWP